MDVNLLYLCMMFMYISEFDVVLLNFLMNLVKLMKCVKVVNCKVKIDVRFEGRYVVIGFEDNGVGILENIRIWIFNVFFMIMVGNDDDSVMGLGIGLGLKIVLDILESYGGWIEVVILSDGYFVCFEFCVNFDVGKD